MFSTLFNILADAGISGQQPVNITTSPIVWVVIPCVLLVIIIAVLYITLRKFRNDDSNNQSLSTIQMCCSENKSYGFLTFLIVGLIISMSVFGVMKFVQYEKSQQIIDSNGTTQGNSDGNTHLFRRSANNNDISVNSDLDLPNLGIKYVILPQKDIDGLVVTVNLLDKNKNIIDSVVKPLGNVKKGVQISFSISLLDLGLSVSWNTKYETIVVTGGTVSYFS